MGYDRNDPWMSCGERDDFMLKAGDSCPLCGFTAAAEVQMDTISDNMSGMKPTQAQIAHVIFNRIANGEDVPEKQRNELLEFLGITAAAEAGEKETGLDYMLRHSVANNNVTIERCAQVLDEKARRTKTAAKAAYEDGAAAIRALKEQP